MYVDIFGTHRRAVPPPTWHFFIFCTMAEGNKVLTEAHGPLRCRVSVSLCPCVCPGGCGQGQAVFWWPGCARCPWQDTWDVTWGGVARSGECGTTRCDTWHGTCWDVAHGMAQNVAHRGMWHRTCDTTGRGATTGPGSARNVPCHGTAQAAGHLVPRVTALSGSSPQPR